MATRKKVTKPKQAASASSLDRYIIVLDDLYIKVHGIQDEIVDLIDSMEAAEKR